MSLTQSEFERFQTFATQKLANGGADSLQELVDLWQAQDPDDSELRESLAALDEGLSDARAGRVRPAREVFEDLAARYELDLPK